MLKETGKREREKKTPTNFLMTTTKEKFLCSEIDRRKKILQMFEASCTGPYNLYDYCTVKETDC